MFSRKTPYEFAILSVEVRKDFNGEFTVSYWSPVLRDHWVSDVMSRELEAEEMALEIQARLALDRGAPNFTD